MVGIDRRRRRSAFGRKVFRIKPKKLRTSALEHGSCRSHIFALECELELKFDKVVALSHAHMHAKFQPQRSTFEEVINLEP